MANLLAPINAVSKPLAMVLAGGLLFHTTVLAADFGSVNDEVLVGESALSLKPLFVPGRVPPVIDVPQDDPVIVEEPKTVITEEPKPVIAPQPSIAELDQWQLIGVMRSSEGNMAIFQDAETDDLHRLKVGESLNGWELSEVKARSAVFRNGTVSANLKFDSERKKTSAKSGSALAEEESEDTGN